ncbi:MAG: hypothetical protein ACK5MV_12700 [Aminipila sp.]
MSKKIIYNKVVEKAKKQLGKEIVKCRGETRSQRNLASAVGLPPSNMKYIEDGVNAPTGDVYAKIIQELKPQLKQQKKMDQLYIIIRNVPPPDVCEIINCNQDLFNIIRILGVKQLSKDQLETTRKLFESFNENNLKGEI